MRVDRRAILGGFIGTVARAEVAARNGSLIWPAVGVPVATAGEVLGPGLFVLLRSRARIGRPVGEVADHRESLWWGVVRS